MQQGMIAEIEQLRARGVKDEWLMRLGLEYRWITLHLQGKWPKDEMTKRLKGAIHAFARRQMTWFNRDRRIQWVANAEQARVRCAKILEIKK